VSRTLLAWVVLACASMVGAPGAEAQPGAPETGLARRLYRDGLEAARDGRFRDAQQAFARSLELAPRASTMLNLAGVERELDLYVEALEHYRFFLRERDEMVESHREAVETEIAELELLVANLRIAAPGIAPGHALIVDGRELPHAALGGVLPVNPGRHSVRVEDEEREVIGSARVEVASGEVRDVSIAIVPRAAPVQEEESTIFESPWFWVIAGGGAAAVIATVIAIAVITMPYTETFDDGNFDRAPWTIPP
jgi:hypothetical protein